MQINGTDTYLFKHPITTPMEKTQLPDNIRQELDNFAQYLINRKLFKTQQDVLSSIYVDEADTALPLDDLIREVLLTAYSEPDGLNDFIAENYQYFTEPYCYWLATCVWDHDYLPELNAEFSLYRISITSERHYYTVENAPETSYFDEYVWKITETLNDEDVIGEFESESVDAFEADVDDVPGKIEFTYPKKK